MKTASKILGLLGLTATYANASLLNLFWSPSTDASESIDSEELVAEPELETPETSVYSQELTDGYYNYDYEIRYVDIPSYYTYYVYYVMPVYSTHYIYLDQPMYYKNVQYNIHPIYYDDVYVTDLYFYNQLYYDYWYVYYYVDGADEITNIYDTYMTTYINPMFYYDTLYYIQ
jgi:hypothetical protein